MVKMFPIQEDKWNDMAKYDDEILSGKRTFTPKEGAANAARTEGLTERHLQRALYWKHRGSCRVMLPNYTPSHWQECDLFVVTDAGYSIEYEIKTTSADFMADFRKSWKHGRLRDCDQRRTSGKRRHAPGFFRPTRFFYVVPELMVIPRDVPPYAGLIYCRWSGSLRFYPRMSVVRPAPRLSPSKVSNEVVQHMQSSSYYRFWSERFKFDDYRATGMQLED